MAKIKGKTIYVSIWITDQYVKVGGQKDATMSVTQEPLDITDKDSAGWKEQELGNRQVTVDFDAFLIEDNAGWLELKKGLINLAADHQKCNCQVDTPAYKYTGNFVMSNLSMAGPNEDMATVSFSLSSDGQITEAAK
jgi:predicted secreted protein